MNYRDIRDEIRSRHGFDAAERYEHEIERDGHSIYSSVYSSRDAVDGCRDWDNERYAKEAYDSKDYERREEERAEEEREESFRRQRHHDEEMQLQAEYERQEAEYLERQEQEEPMPEEIIESENNAGNEF